MIDSTYALDTNLLYDTLLVQWEEGRRNREQTLMLLGIIKKALIKNEKYITTREEEERAHYEQLVQEYQTELFQRNKEVHEFPLPGFFIENNTIYSFYASLDITLSNTKADDFTQLFALKLSHYYEDTSLLDYFFRYHITVNFQNNFSEFYYFLTALRQQKENILYHQNVVEAIDDWLAKSDLMFDLHQQIQEAISHQESSRRKVIHINEKAIPVLVEALSPFFYKDDQKKLLPLLQGSNIADKLYFLSDAARLIWIFFKLKEHMILKDSIVDIENWISRHFTYQKVGQEKSLSKKYVHNKLYELRQKEIPKSKRIDLSGVL